MEEQLQELFSFLRDPKPEVRQLAVQNVAGLTGSREFFPYFKKNVGQVVKDLMGLVRDNPLIAHEALSALINLSVDADMVELMDDNQFLYDMVLTIILPKSVVSDLCCMLLNNLTKNIIFVRKLIPQAESSTAGSESSAPSKQIGTKHLDNLLEVFVRGEGKKFNPNAEFHFLAGVFANVTATKQGGAFMMQKSTVDGTVRLLRFLPFTEHSNVIRRGGVLSTIKNVCFSQEYHHALLMEEEINLLPYLLLPLAGPEDFTDEEMDGMPEELQLLEPSKKREPDPKLRIILIEILLLFTATRMGRDILRQKKVYPIIQKLDLWEQDETVKDRIYRVVDMIMRDEAPDVPSNAPRLTGSGSKGSESKIEEVVDSEEEEEEGDVKIEELI
ncbi:hypothetical protein HK102_013982 [Quaeritorhiza haematococci]|nr:hypothetical protein HK102_013982 [Quaeritorhiza haematococci]